MLRLPDDTTVLSATDLTSYLACEHLFEQRRAIAFGERGKPRPVDDPHAELIRYRGDEHEGDQRDRLTAELAGCVDLSGEVPFTRDGLEAAAAATLGAMRGGAPLIYQAPLFDGRWQGRVDFLRRRDDVRSALGAYAYEVLDTKLSRAVKPDFVHQLWLYTRLLGRVQNHLPDVAYVVLGDGTEEPVALRRFGALHRYLTARVERLAASGGRATYPEPVAHCAVCTFAAECDARRRADDHLSLVAGAWRERRERLAELGLTRVAELAAAPAGADTGAIAAETYELLRHQAALQVKSRVTGRPTHRHLDPARARGFARLPAADPGDLFFDLEGDPYIGDEGGIEYLWGWATADGRYQHLWAHDVASEKEALERFVGEVMERRRRHPGMHVFHYAPHEASKLKSLALRYATCEDEVDELLRHGVLVDLYAIVRQALQVGEESYSLKRLERHHGFVRLERTVREGGGSIVAYEQWLASGDHSLLEAVRAYNEEDCRSTQGLRNWLLGRMRPEAERELGVDFREYVDPQADEEPHEPPAWLPEQQELAARLADGLPAEPAEDREEQAARRLLSQLLLYHWREGKPEWWRFFDLRARRPAELVEEREAIGCLRRDETVVPLPVKRSLDYVFTMPPQEVKLGVGDLLDPTTDLVHHVVAIEDDRIVVRRGKDKPAPEPAALIGTGPIHTTVLREALAELARSVLDGDGGSRAARSLLRAEPPRLSTGRPFRQDGDPSIEEMSAAALDLDGSHLVVQGPPGTGKTYRGARMIVAALRAGRRVGVTAQNHAAIQNLLEAVEEHATEVGFEFAGVYKGNDYKSKHGLVEAVSDNDAPFGDFQLVAGTAWLFARAEHRSTLGLLFIDEAGQFAVANAVAVALATDSLVLLGDPQQLPQVTQASHPGTSGASVLGHLLGDHATVPPDRGFFLPETWRMHPGVCAFVSERSYDDRLHSRPACALRRVTSSGPLHGAGLRFLAAEHEGRSQHSQEEATVIAAACRELLAGGSVADDEGRVHPLKPRDIMVVAPYNLAVACMAAHVPEGVQVGTVDRFQGREAPVVFYAMTCSSGEEVPRGLDFLFNRNRLNVAVSRAQCLAVLVASPRLLDADCRTLEAMELVDGACRFVELATAVEPAVGVPPA